MVLTFSAATARSSPISEHGSAQAPAFRMTPQRQAVLAAVRASDDHPSADEIFRGVRETSPGIGVATVYRTLDLLVRHGYILELRLGDDAVARYDGNVRRHDHVICSECGQVFNVEVPLPSQVMMYAGQQAGVTIAEYDLQFRGRCAACRRTSRSTTAS